MINSYQFALFLDFLTKEKILKKYASQCGYIEKVKHVSFSQLINSTQSIEWHKTKERDDYWLSINSKYYDYYVSLESLANERDIPNVNDNGQLLIHFFYFARDNNLLRSIIKSSYFYSWTDLITAPVSCWVINYINNADTLELSKQWNKIVKDLELL